MVKDSPSTSTYNKNSAAEYDRATLRQIAADCHFLKQHGCVWQDVMVRVAEAERQRQRDLQDTTPSAEIYVDWLGDDIHKMTKAPKEITRIVAREAFVPTQVEMVAATLRTLVEEEHQRRTVRKGGAA